MSLTFTKNVFSKSQHFKQVQMDIAVVYIDASQYKINLIM